MNGVHDMGGMDGFGKVEAEPNEPVVPRAWEGRVLAMQRAMGYAGAWNIDHVALRAGAAAAARSISAASYYERWALATGAERCVERGSSTPTSWRPATRCARASRCRASSTADDGRRRADRAARSAGRRRRRRGSSPATACATKNIHPHDAHAAAALCARPRRRGRAPARLPRLPDSVAIDRGEDPQWLYTVCFDGRELWGADADPTLKVSIEAFEPYLEPAPEHDRDRSRRRAARHRRRRRAFPATPTGRCSASRGRRRPSLALALHERGLFTWPEWAATLGDEIKRRRPPAIPTPARPTTATGSRRSNASSPRRASPTRATLRALRDAWDHAADRTPHGAPIELEPRDFPD